MFMQKFFKIFSFIAIATAMLCTPVYAFGDGQKSFEISRQFDIFNSLFRELDQYYVDSVNPEKVLKNGIEGMMSSYDPYTNYIPESEKEDLQMITTGEYGGIGAVIGVRNGKVLVIEPYQNMPAQKAGLQAGDELVEIAGTKMTTENNNKASEYLKGLPGTEVKIVIRREGQSRLITKKIIRELVAVSQVPYYGKVADKTGYINLNGFTEKATQEVMNAFNDLKSKGIEKLILDLRGNPGGLLFEAVSICNIFVPKGQEIVSTKGKLHQWDQTFKTTREPLDTVIPIVVIVNSGSASSSEIVCGALQDLDRAVILGTRTFGKGLVQTTRSIPYNGVLKITTAKYYIPSGRCIQAIDYSNRNKDGSVGRIPDSLTNEFNTHAGRKVRDGGGIQPDIDCKDERGSAIAYYLMDGMYFFNYANKYFMEHDKITSVADFKIDDKIYQDFVKFVKEKGFTYEKDSRILLDKLKEMLEHDGLTEKTKDEVAALDAKLNNNIDEDFDTYRKDIETLLSSEIVSRYYFQAGEIEQSLKFDPCLKKAIEVLNDNELYRKTLEAPAH
jgi:carboxyl-terminal processing protease